MNWKETLRALCAARGSEIGAFLQKTLDETAEFSTSPLGNVYASIKGDSDHTVLIDAHIDEIRLLVTAIDDSGMIRVDRCGGIDRRVLPGSEVTVWGNQPLYGVFGSTPPHLKTDHTDAVPELDQMGIDIGMTKEEASRVVRPGDEVTFRPEFTELQGGRIAAKTLDNRAGAAVLLRVAELIREADKPLPVSVVLQFSQMEETSPTASGAATGAFRWMPDEAIVVDASFADYPGASYPCLGGLGKGCMIGFSALLSSAISNRLRTLAAREQIPFTQEVMGGRTGTNADHLIAVGQGIPAGLISYPIRNMHTPVEVADPADLESAAGLIFAYLREGGMTA